MMEKGPEPVPPPSHAGEPPTEPAIPDTRLWEIAAATIFVAVFAGVGTAIQLFTGEGVICLVAAALFAIAFQLSLLVNRMRGL